MRQFIEKVERGRHLEYEEMKQASAAMLAIDAEPAATAAFLLGLAKKGETATEVAALAQVMRKLAMPLEAPPGRYMDNCGTGGDGAGSFNISTTAAFVLAGAGVKVAKHGNRKISSRAGSHDVLEALGIEAPATPAAAERMLAEEGLAFLFAPVFHPYMKRIGEVRRAIKAPTIFNLVGPLTNPAPLHAQFTGINRPDFLMEYASVLHMLGRERALVVSGPGGMDEASLAGANSFVLLDKGDLIPFTLTARELGLSEAPLSAIKGGDASENAEAVRSVLRGERGPKFDTVVLNAGLALFACGEVDTIREGVARAMESILSGGAAHKLESAAHFSRTLQKEVLA